MTRLQKLDAALVGAINAGRGILASIESDPWARPAASALAGDDPTKARAAISKRLQALRKRGIITRDSVGWQITRKRSVT